MFTTLGRGLAPYLTRVLTRKAQLVSLIFHYHINKTMCLKKENRKQIPVKRRLSPSGVENISSEFTLLAMTFYVYINIVRCERSKTPQKPSEDVCF